MYSKSLSWLYKLCDVIAYNVMHEDFELRFLVGYDFLTELAI